MQLVLLAHMEKNSNAVYDFGKEQRGRMNSPPLESESRVIGPVLEESRNRLRAQAFMYNLNSKVNL
jgi:hypothetical protein